MELITSCINDFGGPGVCNPGGIFSALGYESWMTERALSSGHHCGSHGIPIIHGLPTGWVYCVMNFIHST